MKSIFSILFLVLVCFSCGKKGEEPSQTLSLNLAEDPDSLDPRVVRTLKDLTLVKQLFDGLMRMDQSGKPIPAIAESVDISEDQLTYTFHLREAKWTNHDPVTAEDFLFSWKSVLDPHFPTDYAHMLFPIKNAREAKCGKCSLDEVGIIALDEKTLVVQLENPTPYFLELVSFPTSFPVHSKIASQDSKWCLPPGDRFICNGPFSIKKWAPDASLELVKNECYWEKEKVLLPGITLSVISDNMTEGLLFEKGELDWLGQPLSNNISPEVLGKMRECGALNSYFVAGTFWLKFNTKVEPFNNQKMRQAFSYAINRQNIVSHILRGGQVAALEVLPPSMAIQSAPLFEDGNILLAQKLFKEALEENGWDEKTLPKITFSYSPSERNSKITQFVADEWRKIFGVEVAMEALEFKYYRQNCKQGKFQVGIGDWIADFNDPVSFLDLFKTKDNGLNDSQWEHAEYTALLDQALHERSIEKRKELLQRAEKILVEEMPVAPLYHYSFDYVKRGEVKDVVLSPIGSIDFKYASKKA